MPLVLVRSWLASMSKKHGKAGNLGERISRLQVIRPVLAPWASLIASLVDSAIHIY